MSDPVATLEQPTPGARPWLSAAIVVAAGLAVYANTLNAPFVFDAVPKIVENTDIRRAWPPWGWLTHDRRPVAYLSFAVNYALHGLDVRGYHVVNLAIHVTAALVLMGILRRTLSTPKMAKRYQQVAQRMALAVALIWVVHPLQTQCVTYIVQRIESLMGLFYLATLYAFIRAAGSRNATCWLAVSVASCLLGIATKEVTATAPLVVLWYDRVFIADSWTQLWARRRFYYLALFGTWCGLAYLMATRWSTYGGNAGVVAGLTPIDYALSQPGVLLHYLRLCFWPSGQCLDYWWPVARTADKIVPPFVIVLVLLAATAWSALRYPSWGFLGGCFFVILAPTSSVVPIRDLAFEHRMYLPLAAVVTLFVAGGFELTQRISTKSLRQAVQRAWWTAVVPLVVLLLGGVTLARNEVYRSDLSVWRDVLDKARHNPRAHYNFGRALHNLDRRREAIEYYRRAIRVDPEYPQLSSVYSDLGIAFQELGDLQTAVGFYRRALNRNPQNAQAHSNLGVALIQTGRTEEAVESFRQAADLDPGRVEFRVNLAKSLHEMGELDEAIAQYERALEMDSTDHRALTGLQKARLQQESQRQ